MDRSILIPADPESMKKLMETTGRKSVVPLDDALEISILPFRITPALMLRCAYWAQKECSYQKVEDMLLETYGVIINDDSVRKVTNLLGKAVFKEECRRAQEAVSIHPPRRERRGVLYIQLEDGSLGIRGEDGTGSAWIESRSGAVFTSDQPWKKDYVCLLGSGEEFEKHLYAAALDNGYGRYHDTVILSNGSPWVAEMAAKLFPNALIILDLLHLKERICRFAGESFNYDQTLYLPWAEELIHQLEEDRTDQTVNSLTEHCPDLYPFIQEHKGQINYPLYREKGLLYESECHIELQNRLAQAGNRWEPETAQYLLTLKCRCESGRWEKDVVEYVMKNLKEIVRT